MPTSRNVTILTGALLCVFLLLSLHFSAPSPPFDDQFAGETRGEQHDDPNAQFRILPVEELSNRPNLEPPADDGIHFEFDDEKKPEQGTSLREQLRLQDPPHSPTLTFSHIYVVSLPTRSDRRTTMSRIADALNLKFTFIDAVLKDSPLITWIGEQVYTVRKQKRVALAKALGVSPQQVGGMGIGSIWLARAGQEGPDSILELGSLENAEFGQKDWIHYLEDMTDTRATPAKLQAAQESVENRLRPKDGNFNLTAELWDSVEEKESRQIVPGVLSTWFSHVKAMKTALANGDESALILEDDVDIEWDIESKWNSIHRWLPKDWEVVFLGHCWGREMTSPTRLHPHLFYSTMPRCLHGYAMSRAGLQKTLKLLSDPWVAYQAPVDVTIPTFAQSGLLSPYSVEPPLIIQSKDSPSDIQPGTGSPWRGLLADSTLDRIWRDEEKDVPLLTWEEAIKDPSVTRPRLAGKVYRR